MSGPFEPSNSHDFHHPSGVGSDAWDDLPSPDEGSFYGDQAPPYAGSPQAIHASVQYGVHPDQAAYQRQPFPHSLSSPQIMPPPLSSIPARVARHSSRRSGTPPADLHRHSQQVQGLGIGMSPSSSSTLAPKRQDVSVNTGHDHDPLYGVGGGRSSNRHSRQSSSLHPYVMTFTSPIGMWFRLCALCEVK